MIDVGNDLTAAFVDGGVSMANNPSLTLLMVATLKGFPYHWKMGEDNLKIVSVGTGYSVFKKKVGDIEDAWLGTWAQNVPNMLMQDASWQNQILMQWISNSPNAKEIDMEIGTLEGDYIGGKPQIEYLRYNFPMTEETLNGLNLGRTFNEEETNDVIEMSNAHNRQILYQIGRAAADGDDGIHPNHF
jgi:hypothetical protein